MKALKVLTYIILGAIVLSIALVVGAVFALSSSWGQLKLLDYVNTQIPGKVSAKTLNLSLFGEQKIEGFTLTGKDGKIILSADKIVIDSPIATMAASRELGGSAEVQGLQATFELTPNGSFNISDALGLPSPDIKTSTPFAPVIVRDVNASMNFNKSTNTASITAKGLTEQGAQKGNFQITAESGNTPKIQVIATHFPVAIIDQLAALNNPKTAGLYLSAIGETIDFNIQQAGSAEGASFQGTFKSPTLSGNLQGNFQANAITLQAPSEINFLLTPAFNQKIKQLNPSANLPNISQPVSIKVVPTEVVAIFKNGKFDLFNSTIKGTAKVGPGIIDNFDLTDLNVDVQSLKGAPNVQVKVTGNAKQDGKPINLNLQIEVQKPKDNNLSAQELMKALKMQTQLQGLNYLGKAWDVNVRSETAGTKAKAFIVLQTGTLTLPEMQVDIDYSDLEKIVSKITIPSIPVAMLNDFASGKDFQPLLGSTLAVNGSGTFNQKGYGQFLLDAQSSSAQAQAQVAYDGHFKLLQGKNAPSIKLKIDPEQFALLHRDWLGQKNEAPFKLAKPMTIDLRVPEFKVNFANLKSGADLKAEVELSEVAVIDPVDSKKLTLGKIQGQVQTKENSNTLDWNFNVNGLGEGSIILAGTLPSPFATSDFSIQNLDFNVHLESQGVPIGMATRFAGFDPKWSSAVEAIFGSRVEIKADANLNHVNGPVKASIVGDNGSVVIDGKVANGWFVLNNPLVAQSTVTPQFGKDVFGLILPILNSAISAENPIMIQISPQGFAFPVSPYDFSKISFSNATIELGRIRFNNQGELAQLLGLLNVKSQDSFNVWFTPAYLSLKQGYLKIERFDMLAANQYPLAVWGNIDFPNDYVNVEVGLTGKAIGQAMGIKGLDSDGMLIVPLRGPVGKPRIDKTKVAAQISRIAIESQIPEGKLIGGILGIASGVLGGDTQPPPPTTNPLPWDNGEKKKEGNVEKVIDKVQKGVDKVQKGIGKGVGTLINSLIPD